MAMQTVTLKLPNRCLFDAVGGIWEQYLALATADATTVIDAGEVTHVDMAGLQVVLAMVRDLVRQNRVFEWQGRSDEFRACAQLGGLEKPLLTDPV